MKIIGKNIILGNCKGSSQLHAPNQGDSLLKQIVLSREEYCSADLTSGSPVLQPYPGEILEPPKPLQTASTFSEAGRKGFGKPKKDIY